MAVSVTFLQFLLLIIQLAISFNILVRFAYKLWSKINIYLTTKVFPGKTNSTSEADPLIYVMHVLAATWRQPPLAGISILLQDSVWPFGLVDIPNGIQL